MPGTTIVVPRGPEAAAVRRGAPSARVAEMSAGVAAAGALPPLEPGDTVLALGLCGALWRIRRGEVVIYGRVVDPAGVAVIDPEIVDALSTALPQASVVNACTTRSVVTSVDARRVLAQRFNAEVVDMEGTHLARAVAGAGARFGSIRVVSDDATRDLPPIEDAIDAEGRMRPLELAFAFAKRPGAAWRFVRDVRSSLHVLTQVARALSSLPD